MINSTHTGLLKCIANNSLGSAENEKIYYLTGINSYIDLRGYISENVKNNFRKIFLKIVFNQYFSKFIRLFAAYMNFLQKKCLKNGKMPIYEPFAETI